MAACCSEFLFFNFANLDLRKAAVQFILDHKKHYQGDPSWREMIKNNPDLLMDFFMMT